MKSQNLYFTIIDSPVGKLHLVASGKGLRSLHFAGGKHKDGLLAMGMEEASGHPVLVKAQEQLAEYFAGKRIGFDLPLDMQGTVFQIKAWRELQKIPYGQTISYADQAKGLGDAKKARAVGMANGNNPLSIIVPCHRVVGSDGTLTGFGGGIRAKAYLLAHELQHVAALTEAA